VAPERCLKLIGFTNTKNVPRQHFMSTVQLFTSAPADLEGGVALSSLIHALHETDSVAIVRYVARAKAAPQLAVLYPCIKSEYECLYYVKLPFSEDIRQYPFAPLSIAHTRKQFIPSKDQLDAASNLIESLDLMHSTIDESGEPMEALKPKHTYNPTLQHFYQSLQKRALNSETPLPKLDPVIFKYIHPDEQLFTAAAVQLTNFKSNFTLTKTENIANKKRKYWQDCLTEDVKLDSYIPDLKKQKKRR